MKKEYLGLLKDFQVFLDNMPDEYFTKLVKSADDMPFKIVIPKINTEDKMINKRDLCKFRAWLPAYDAENSTKDNIITKKQMFYDVESWQCTTLCDRSLGSPIPFDEIFHYKEPIIMQCTGIKDINGNLIYEGDVVEVEFCPERKIKFTVNFGQYETPTPFACQSYGFYLLKIEEEKGMWSFDLNRKMKILGNIYETKDFKYLSYKTIKFSKNYVKLHNQTSAELIELREITLENMSDNDFEDLVEYDCKSVDGTYFPLDKNKKYYLLIFLGNKNITFQTLREHIKYSDYKKYIGETFAIEVIKND